MNYKETKEFQNHIIDTTNEIIISLMKMIKDGIPEEAMTLLTSYTKFVSYVDIIIPKKIDSTVIEHCSFNTFPYNNNFSEIKNEIQITKLKLNIRYKEDIFGVEVLLNQKIFDDKLGDTFDVIYKILGSITPSGFIDTNYDIKYHPIVLSKNPYSVAFFDDEYGYISTIEYLDVHEFDFPYDYNQWGEEEFIMQKLAIN